MDDAQLLAELKARDRQLHGSLQYDDETYRKLLSHYRAYSEAKAQLRALPLGEVQPSQVLPAGGVK